MEWGNAITYLAETLVKGAHTRFGVKDADRTHHIALVGRDDGARANFLANMALQDAARGAGVLVMDAGGELVRLFLERLPKDAGERLIVIDPSDGEHPYSWNPLDDFRALPPEAAGPTLSDVLANVYQCEHGALTDFAAAFMLAHADATSLFLYTIVTDQKAREQLLPWKDADRAKFEAALAASEDAATSVREYGQYLGKDTLMRNLLGQAHSKFTLAPLASGGIVVVDLSRIRMFPTRVTPLARLVLAAARTRGTAASPIAIYLDDCLRYLSEHEIDRVLLDRAIALTATDTSRSGKEGLQERLLQRSGSVLAFAPSDDDMHIVGQAFYPYVAAEELQKLPDGALIAALMIDSVRSRPFFADALPLPERSGASTQDLWLASRDRYTISRLAADKLFKPPAEEKESDKKKAESSSFSSTFRSMFAKPAETTEKKEPNAPKAPAAAPAPAPKAPAEALSTEQKPPDTPKNVTGTRPEPAKPEIPEEKLKKMLRVRRPRRKKQ